MNKIIASAKSNWAANKTKILSIALATVSGVAIVQHIAIKQHNDFLESHDLLETFYSPEQ